MALTGKVAMVTGGAVGIGEGIVARLAREHASMLIADLDAEAGQTTADRFGAMFQRTDVCSDEDLRSAMAITRRELGGLDILINNAGGVGEPNYPEAPVQQWSRVLDLNLRSVMVATQLAVERMADRGGAIINISSIAGLGFAPHTAPEYAAAKAGIVRLTTTLKPLRERFGIRVNCICPDLVDTPSSRRSRSKMTSPELAALPPVLEPSEIADVVMEFIENDEHAGRVMVVRGGEPWYLLPAG